MPVTTRDPESIESLRRRVFELLELLRVYTRTPGKQPDRDHPFVMHVGDTIYELAQSIHNDLAERLHTAKVWGSGKFDGQLVQKDYELRDEDVVEIHVE